MSETLQAFYVAYKQWLDDGAPINDLAFDREDGLCWCLNMYLMQSDSLLNSEKSVIREEMTNQFIEANLDESYPFGPRNVFTRDEINAAMHLNKKRIAWVNNHQPKE